MQRKAEHDVGCVQVEAGGPVYHIRNQLVNEMKPTVIITQEQCRICAVTSADLANACGALGPNVTVVTIKPVTLDDVFDDVRAIARAMGVGERGERLAGFLQRRIESIADVLPQPAASGDRRPVVAHVEWLAPLMGSGYWITQCAEAAGCMMVHGERGGHSPTLPGVAALSNADVILIAPCGFSIERTYQELNDPSCSTLLQSSDWHTLPAVRAGAVFIADGNKYFNRSSCGVLESAEIFAEVAHPELCGLWGHHGKRWVRLQEAEAFCKREGAPPPNKHVDLAPGIVGAEPEVVSATEARQPEGTASRHVEDQLEARARPNDFPM